MKQPVIEPASALTVDLEGIARDLNYGRTKAYAVVKSKDFPTPLYLTNGKSPRWVRTEFAAWLASQPRGSIKDEPQTLAEGRRLYRDGKPINKPGGHRGTGKTHSDPAKSSSPTKPSRTTTWRAR